MYYIYIYIIYIYIYIYIFIYIHTHIHRQIEGRYTDIQTDELIYYIYTYPGYEFRIYLYIDMCTMCTYR